MSDGQSDKPLPPTPRTDAHCADIGGDDGLCYSSFARQLERELAEVAKLSHQYRNECERLERALAEAEAGHERYVAKYLELQPPATEG